MSGDQCRNPRCGLGSNPECAKCDPPKVRCTATRNAVCDAEWDGRGLEGWETGCTDESNAYDDGETCADHPEDIGAPCDICARKAAEAMREARAEYDHAAGERDLAALGSYAEQMRDAGRGHLLRPGEE